jgi:cell division protein FtsL
MITTVSKVTEWVPEDQAKEFKVTTWSELGKHWAGIINTNDGTLYKIRAPPLYAIATLGRPELRGKLITQPPLASDPEPRRERAAARREMAADEDDDELVRSRFPVVEQCPPHLPREWDKGDQVWRCPRCSVEIPSDDIGDDCSHNESDDDDDYDPSADGGNKRKRVESAGSADDNDDEQQEPPGDGSPPKRLRVAAGNVAGRVANWVIRLAAAEATVFYTASAVISVTNIVYANVVHRASVELPIAVERERITELETTVRKQHNRITDLEQQVAALTAEQQRVTELELIVAVLQQQMATGVAAPAAADSIPVPTMTNTGFWYLLKTLSSGAKQYRPAFIDGGMWYYVSGNPNDVASPKKRTRIPSERYNAIEERTVSE